MILYFTGTGNSFYIAKKLSQALQDELLCINDRIKKNDNTPVESQKPLCQTKTFSFKGVKEIIMPENYIALYDAPEAPEAKRIIQHSEPAIEDCVEVILHNSFFQKRTPSAADRIKSSFTNPVFYRFVVKADKFKAVDKCIGCGKCKTVCPLNNIELKENKPVWGKNCTHCMACICKCPVEAIEYGKSSTGKPRYQCPL